MKVLLINPLAKEKELKRHGGDSQLPLGLLWIGAMLQDEGHRVKIIDNEWSKYSDKIFEVEVREFNPQFVGITFFTAKYESVLSTAKLIKKINKNIHICAGGPHVMMAPFETINEIKELDSIINGEGEFATVELVNALENYSDLSGIRGLLFRGSNGEIKKNEKLEFIDDLDALPLPAIELAPDFRKRRSTYRYKQLPATGIITSRGCPFSCIFCNTTFGKKYRTRSAENVVKEIELLVNKYSFKEITILDDLFFLDPKRTKKICELIIEKDIKITWSCNARVDILYQNLEILPLLKKAGCWYLSFGIENGNQELLKMMKKKIDLEQVRVVTKEVHRHGFFQHAGFILGMPKDTKENIRNTINFAKSLPLDGVQFSIAVPYPGTELYEIAAEYGTFIKDDYKNMATFTKDPVFIANGLSKKYLKNIQKKAYREFYFRFSYIFRQFRFLRDWNNLKKYLHAGYSHFKLYLLNQNK